MSVTASTLGQVSGQLEAPEVDSCRGMVSLWPQAGHSIVNPGRFNSVPPWVAELAPDCSFVIVAAPGNYFLRGLLRKTPGPNLGPLRAGDLIFMSPDADGKVLPVEVVAGQSIDVGIHSSCAKFLGYPAQIKTGVTGRLVDVNGKPVVGLLVQAFATSDMGSRPLAISAPSDKDGRYRLRFAEKGRVYLQARKEIGIGLPPLGSYSGVYGGKNAKAVKIVTGKLIDKLIIIVERRTVTAVEAKDQ